MKRFSFLLQAFVLALGLMAASCASRKGPAIVRDEGLASELDRALEEGAAQYKVMMRNLPPDRLPKTYYAREDRFETSNTGWWTSGFYPGSLLHLYEQTKDPVLYTETERILHVLEKEKHNKSTHDLGFMMFCSFGHANRIAPKPEYKEILVTSARSLATRFNPKVGAIRSWDSKGEDFIVIIDNMMNLELLFWAAEETGDTSLRNIALTHANTTIKHHFRPDNSSYHVINYHPETGAVQQKKTAQGFGDETAWARGQAWGLYGYTVMYRLTRDKVYLDQANKIAQFLLNHPNMPEDRVPFWDFNAPDIPKAKRDASAAAIMASALLELQGYTDAKTAAFYVNNATRVLKTLLTDQYRAKPGTNGGFILMHSVGHLPAKSEVDVPLTYADYYFIEAARRYKALAK